MTNKSSSRGGKKHKKQKGLPWWLGLIVPVTAIVGAVWFFQLPRFEVSEINKREVPAVDKHKIPISQEPEEIGPFEETIPLVEEYPSKETPWIALIIDDFGPPGTAKWVDSFLDLPFDLTFSIIPGNMKSVSIGRKINEAGGEVMIHLPMEPKEKESMEERDMVMVGIDAEELKTILDRVQNDLPHALGMNNHMGSKATTNDTLMQLLAAELKERKLYFVDSRTADYSRAYPNMVAAGVPVIGRDIFIDNSSDSTNFFKQVKVMLRIAHRRGWAVGIAHARSKSKALLESAVPLLKDSGVQFVTVGKLIDGVGYGKRERLAAARK